MKSEWREKMEKEFAEKEADFLARQPKPQEALKDAEKADERHIENQIRMLTRYGNAELAREKEIEFDVKNRMFREGWEANGSINLALGPDLTELLAGELDNENYRIVILPKEKRAIIFRARIRKRG